MYVFGSRSIFPNFSTAIKRIIQSQCLCGTEVTSPTVTAAISVMATKRSTNEMRIITNNDLEDNIWQRIANQMN